MLVKKVNAIHTNDASALVKEVYDTKNEEIEKKIPDHINILLLLNLMT